MGSWTRNTAFVQLLVIHRDADAYGFRREYNHWAGPGECGVFDEAGGDEFTLNHDHLLIGRGMDAVEPRRDTRALHGNRYLEGDQGAGAIIG